MKSENLEPNREPSTSQPVQQSLLLFLGGSGAGLVTFAIFGGIWQVAHFWWVMSAVTLSCGVLAVVFRKNFQELLSALLDDLPWIS
jgi:hypothetical protein